MTDSQAHREIQLLDYWKVIVRRKWIVLIFGLVVMLTTAVLTMRQKKEYLATTTLHLDLSPPRVVDFEETNGPMGPRMMDYQAFYNTQFQIINSRTVKQGAIDRLRAKGYTDWDGTGDPVAAFSGNLQVNPVKDTRLVQIGYIHTDPNKAAEIANTVAQVYIEENMNRKVQTSQAADEWLTRQAQSWREKKRVSDMRLLEYKQKNDLMSLEEKSNVFQKNLSEIYDAYNRARADRIGAETEYKTLQEYLNKGQYDALISYFSTDIIKSLKEQYNDIDRQYQSLSERYLPKFPQMVRLDNERKTLQKKLQEEIARLVKGKEAEYVLRKNKEESLQSELTRAKNEASEVESKMVDAEELMNESDRNERFFKQLDKRQAEVNLVELLRTSPIEVIDSAIPPVGHVRPNLTLNLTLALVVSLTGGIGLAFSVEYLDKTFKSPDEVERFLDTPLLGIFPIIEQIPGGPNRDTYVYHNPKSAVAECCRSIRTNIMLGTNGKPVHSLLVTSASPREGKSTLVVSLGITMALNNSRTLLVDTDLRRPRLHHVFNRGLETGLTSLINETAGYDKAIFPTEVPNLFILPSGPIPANPSEMLGSPRMETILRELGEQFDMIIFDSPPCIPVTDAVVLSTKTDGVIFVIKQDSTAKDVALEARRRLGEISDNLIGCIVNNIDMERDSYGYRYYYYYHYYGEDSGQGPV